jgi:hypothetical protein
MGPIVSKRAFALRASVNGSFGIFMLFIEIHAIGDNSKRFQQ